MRDLKLGTDGKDSCIVTKDFNVLVGMFMAMGCDLEISKAKSLYRWVKGIPEG
jgi:hypothetical protein